jgi:hypothetical protein
MPTTSWIHGTRLVALLTLLALPACASDSHMAWCGDGWAQFTEREIRQLAHESGLDENYMRAAACVGVRPPAANSKPLTWRSEVQ